MFIPLRSMFEQMGATVSYDPSSKTATISKAGAEVVVTVGKPEVVINGESRPLDVPPIVYQGVVLVPVRVISEGMGAYVQWVPDRHLVVVRYVPATPPPTEAPPPPAPEETVAPAATTAGDAESTEVRRLLPFVLLHASERVEQSRRTIQLHARRQVQHGRRQSGVLEQRDRRFTASTTSKAAGTSAPRIFMPIRSTVRASSQQITRRARSA